MRGVWAAVLTPVDDDLSPDAARAIPYYRDLLDNGCDGLNLLGTTGEAMSFDAAQRMAYMEAIASSGLPRERLMAGAGAASLTDAVRLTRCAFDCGFAASLVMPPFFYRDVSDDGIVAFFAALFARTDPPRGGVLLYNFPRMSIAFHGGLVARLLDEFGDVIAGMKDSSNDPHLQRDVLALRPDLLVFPGSESDLLDAKRRGVAGCISGSVALWPHLARDVFESDDEAKAAELTRKRAALDGLPFIPAVRYLTAARRDDPAWERLVPPQTPLTPDQRADLMQRVGR
ncbi:MAG TPA: dihydrodipicolinate synthase family protein [Candidatus Binatia bacterium]|nr:dihydrodipicolinate synthase family protein [Candidatus Binatia bacterium]